MENILTRINYWRWQRAARTIVYTASLIIVLGAAPAAAAAKCKKAIKACGCVAKKGHYALANDLTSSSAGADCLTIAGAHVTLDMAGHQMTGPGGVATGAGIHVMSSGGGAFIDGVNQKITGFGTGILVDASDVAIAFVSLRSNAQYGLKINGGSRNSLYNSDAGTLTPATGNGTAGVLISNGSGNLIDDISADRNGMYGIEINGGSNNALHDLDGDFNNIYGIWINGSNGNRVTNFTGNSNSQIGLYIGCAPIGGISAGCTAATGSTNVVDLGELFANGDVGIAVDAGDLANQIGLNAIGFGLGLENGISDAVDANTNCGTNLWFNDEIGTTPAQACIK
jgi:hypothetical protein